jgi:Domain of unknown function (DUF4166)
MAPLHAEGTIDVEHGRGWLTPVITSLMKLPAAGLHQAVRLDVVEDGSELLWTRRIGKSILRTRQRASDSRLEERSGPGRISFDLAVEGDALRYRQSSIHVAGLRVPPSLSPIVGAVVSPTVDGWRVVVTVEWRGRIICRYGGSMRAS